MYCTLLGDFFDFCQLPRTQSRVQPFQFSSAFSLSVLAPRLFTIPMTPTVRVGCVPPPSPWPADMPRRTCLRQLAGAPVEQRGLGTGRAAHNERGNPFGREQAWARAGTRLWRTKPRTCKGRAGGLGLAPPRPHGCCAWQPFFCLATLSAFFWVGQRVRDDIASQDWPRRNGESTKGAASMGVCGGRRNCNLRPKQPGI